MNVGVLVRPSVVEWQRAALENVAAMDDVTITHAVVDASQRTGRSTLAAGEAAVNRGRSLSVRDLRLFVDVLREDGLKSVLYADQKLGWVLFGEENGLHYLRSTPVEDVACLADATITDCRPVSLEGPWKTLPAGTTDTLGNACDVVLRFGFGLLKGEILDAPRFGVLSAHAADIRDYRGMGPRMAFLNDDPTVSVTLQQLTDEIDGGRILAVATRPLPDRPTMDDVYGAVYELQTTVFADGIAELIDGAVPYEPDELGDYHSHERMRTDPLFVSRIVLKNNLRRTRKAIRGLRADRERESVSADPR